MENRITTIKLMHLDDKVMVSSKEVAEKFRKEHKNVLRDIRDLQVPDNFRLLNFEERSEPDSQGIDRPVIYMTRDGFSIIAFGFTGKKALKWKLGFLEAFNKMEHVIHNQIPALRNEISGLRKENYLLTQKVLSLPGDKKPHGNKDTIIVPVQVNTIFGPDIEYKRVKRESKFYSDLTRKEGEMKRLSNLVNGMAKKISQLTDDVALLRRM